MTEFEEWQLKEYGNIITEEENKEAYIYRINKYRAESLSLSL